MSQVLVVSQGYNHHYLVRQYVWGWVKRNYVLQTVAARKFLGLLELATMCSEG